MPIFFHNECNATSCPLRTKTCRLSCPAWSKTASLSCTEISKLHRVSHKPTVGKKIDYTQTRSALEQLDIYLNLKVQPASQI